MAKQIAVILLMLITAGCERSRTQSTAQPTPTAPPTANKSSLELTSVAFREGQSIPRQFSCDGVNISPPLEWSGVPKTARTLAIIADDPDAPSGTFVHWVIYNLPADNIGLVENLPMTESLKAGGFQGKNDFDKIGYGGPCPPSGTHHYYFKIYALDGELPFRGGAAVEDIQKAMEGHIVAQAQLMGTYRRQ